MSNAVKNALTTIDGRIDGLEADMDLLHGEDTNRFGGVASDARSPFRAQSTVNTGAAAVALKAAVASKRHWVTEWEVCNKTAGEYPVCELTEDYAGTPVIKSTTTPDQPIATSLGYRLIKFDPPIEITAGTSIGFQLQSATGDVYSAISGWVED